MVAREGGMEQPCISATFGATACKTWAKMPSRVAIRCGLYITACFTITAASSGVMVGTLSYILVGAIIGVRTSGILMVVKLTPVSLNSEAAQREKASSAALEET